MTIKNYLNIKKIGKSKNNQIIISTHSPDIIGSVSKKDLIILKKIPNKIELVDIKSLNETKGMEVNDILAEIHPALMNFFLNV